MQEQLAHIAPGSPYESLISRPGWVPSQQDVDDMIDALNTAIDEVASEIASGHASGGRIDYEFEALINSTIRNPTESGIMPNGRIWYYETEMEIEDIGFGQTSVKMTTEERYIITNCLAYLCYAQRPPGLQSIAGAPFNEIESVLEKLLSVSSPTPT